ncbi:MAG: glycosyltransferase family 4 protein [Patescibacteria group bacterium]
MNLKPTGVIWAGPVYNIGGYGNVSRNYIKGLVRIGVSVRIFNLDRVDLEIGKDNIKFLDSLSNTYVGTRPVLIVHSLPPHFDIVKIPKVYKRIGCTIFETNRIPKVWVKPCNRMDEIWVPSHFNLKTFSDSGVKKEKIKVIPYAVDTNIFNPKIKPLPLLSLKKFKFLYVFNYSYRKAPEILLEAYLKEFKKDEDVCLMLKSINTDYPNLKFNKNHIKKIITKIRGSGNNLPQVHLIDSPSSIDELASLYKAIDCYISVDRANGWGMPCMEAMAVGKPAATVNWSGSTEFMKKNNSFLISPKRLVAVDKKTSKMLPIYSGQKWADIDINSLRKLLRYIYQNKDKRIEIARNGYNTIVNNFSIEAIAQITASQLGFSRIKIYNKFLYFMNSLFDIKHKGLKRLFLRLYRQVEIKV